ncbi:phosphonatase-like hydrolase [Leucobacter sp. HY1910]
MITLAAFDMAGTTINDGGAVYRALEQAVTETGVAVAPADLQTWMGAEKRAAITALIRLGGGSPEPASVVDAAYARFQEILDELYTATPPQPIDGVPETIALLQQRGIKVALTTGFSRDVAEGILAQLGWVVGAATPASEPAAAGEPGVTRVDALSCGDEVPAGRPAPFMIHRVMEATGTADVAQVLVAGDTVVDVQAGAASGAAVTLGVLTGKLERAAFDGQPFTAVLGSVAEIPAFLDARVI